MLFLGILFAFQTMAQNDQSQIEKVIQTYVQGGDHNNSKEFTALLDANFRVAFSDASKGEVSMLDKDTYSMLIDTKKFGGDKRKIHFTQVDVYGGINATAKVKLEGEKATMYNYISLAKLNGKWMIIQDFVHM